jgi:alpha-beta hydrolase superfamily lysophospholipase
MSVRLIRGVFAKTPSLAYGKKVLSIAAVALLAACSPTEQFHQKAVQPPVMLEGRYLAADMTSLPLRQWLPKARPKAAIIALHGFNDYSHAFAGPGGYFAAHGIATYAYDQRGFGETADRGIWAGQANLTRDASGMVEAVHKAHPGVPVYLLGESMGGAVVIALLAEQPRLPLAGAILSGPALWGSSSMNWFYQGTLWMGAHTFPWYTVTGRGLKILASDNIPMLIALGKDPLVIKETRIDAIYGIVNLMDTAQERIGDVQYPLLGLYGANDQVIPLPPVQDSFLRLKAPHRVAFYPDGYHMLLRDLQAEVVLRDIVSWVTRPQAPLPSGFDQNCQDRMRHAKAPMPGMQHKAGVQSVPAQPTIPDPLRVVE